MFWLEGFSVDCLHPFPVTTLKSRLTPIATLTGFGPGDMAVQGEGNQVQHLEQAGGRLVVSSKLGETEEGASVM